MTPKIGLARGMLTPAIRSSRTKLCIPSNEASECALCHCGTGHPHLCAIHRRHGNKVGASPIRRPHREGDLTRKSRSRYVSNFEIYYNMHPCFAQKQITILVKNQSEIGNLFLSMDRIETPPWSGHLQERDTSGKNETNAYYSSWRIKKGSYCHLKCEEQCYKTPVRHRNPKTMLNAGRKEL